MTEEPKQQCQHCGTKEKTVKEYKPNSGKHPDKRAHLCGDCAAKGGKWLPAEPVEVPAISPAVPTPANEPEKPNLPENEPIETKEFKGTPPAPIEISEPAEETENPDPEPENKPITTEPIDRAMVKEKLINQEKDLNKLLESRKRLIAQLGQVNEMIGVRKGAVAMLRDVLGNEG